MTNSVASLLDGPPKESLLSIPTATSIATNAEARILGVSTADQVLERWHGFLKSATEELRNKASEWEDRHRLILEGPPLVERACHHPEAISVVDEAEPLGLHSSPVGRGLEALSGAMLEARACIAEAQDLFRQLALFGEAQGPQPMEVDTMQAGLLVELAEFLPVFGNTLQLLKRVDQIGAHIVRQLSGFQSLLSNGGQRSLQLPLRPVLDALGALLVVPVVIDGLVLENSQMRRAYSTYTFVVGKSAASEEGRTQSAEYNQLAVDTAIALGGYLREIDFIIQGDAFKVCISRIACDLGGMFLETSSSAALREQLVGYFKVRLEESELVGKAAQAKMELPAESLVPWVCTLVLFSAVWPPGKSDARLVTDVLKMHKQSPVVVLYGRIAWCIGDFFQAYLPQGIFEDAAKRDLVEMGSLRQRQAVRLDEGHFIKEMQKSNADVQTWLASLGATGRALDSGHVSMALKEARSMVLRGLALALRVRAFLEEYLVLHIRGGVPVPRSCLSYISLGFQLLKAIETAPSAPRMGELSLLLQRNMALTLHTELENSAAAAAQRTEEGKAAMVRVALVAAYRIVGGARSDNMDWYFDVGALALCTSGQAHFTATAKGSIWRELRIMSRWWEQLARLCDTSWSYWVRDLLPDLLRDTVSRGSAGVLGLPRLCSAFASPLDRLVPANTRLGKALVKELKECLKEAVISPLIQKIEQDLRLHNHGVMQSALEHLPKVPTPDVLTLLKLRPLTLSPHMLLDIKDAVEKQMSKTFYNLTALAPHDAEAYCRMRALARDRYGLSVLDGHLPCGSLDHGLDVIDIMRSIHLFAAQYSYSLHQQWFAQFANQGDAKVRVITVDHLANSIRIHGMGIINTTVNYTYGFMKRKLEVVAEFLSDEAIKSRMLQDWRWMEEQKANKSGYTWSRAMETVRFIRRLGAAADGSSFLDKVRVIVTQIGNALGYVRTVRSAGMRCVGRGLPYVEAGALERPSDTGQPDLLGADKKDGAICDEDIVAKGNFAPAAGDAQCPPLVKEAADVADEAVRSVRSCFERSTDYLNLLANVFAKNVALLESANSTGGQRSPMSLFHLLVPSLTISYLYSILVGRESLAKRAVASATTLRSNALCFDDGFAVGVACILSIFGQEHDFQTLHWFDAQVLDSDAGVAPTAPTPTPSSEAGAVGSDSTTARRREMLQRELGRFYSTWEAASSLFDPSAS